MAEGSGGLKLYNFLFEAQLNYVEIAINFDCSLQILWKRGTQKIQTEESVILEKSQGKAYFNETLKMNSTMYFDEGKQQFLEKKSQFTVVIITEKGNKIAGQCTIDLAQYVINQINTQEETLSLQKCPAENSKINFIMRVKYLGEGAAAEVPVSMESISNIKGSSNRLTSQIDIGQKPRAGNQLSSAYNQELAKENTKLKQENNDLQKSIQKLQESGKSSSEQNKWETKYKELSLVFQQNDDELKNYKQLLIEKDKQINQLIQENHQLKNSPHKSDNNNQQGQNQQKLELQMLQEENSQIKKQLQLLKINPGTEEEIYEIKTAELDELIETVKELQDENEQYQLKIEKLQKYQTQAQVKMSDQMKEISGLQEQLVRNKQIIGDTINFIAENSNQEFLQEMMKQIKLS